MRSIRTKMTLFTACMSFVIVISAVVISVLFIRGVEKQQSNQLLLLLCETGERNLDYYFNNVQKSVDEVASFVKSDLDGLENEQLNRHVQSVRKRFDEVASKTSGVLTYYYRINPEISDSVEGFWYTDLDGEGFREHAATDINLYNTEDTSKLMWFTVPKHEGEAVWLPPYVTENLDVLVISYNVPIYWRGVFVGVVGIEIDYSTMVELVESIRLYESGHAFLSDSKGRIFYHPLIDVSQYPEGEVPMLPEGAVGKNTFVRYVYEGEEMVAAWLPLSNGMRINIEVPASEIEGDWKKLIQETLVYIIIVLLVSNGLTWLYARRIAGPLEKLTDAAEQMNQGNYDIDLEYEGDDEVGRLTGTFKRLVGHMKDHISDLNRRAYVDPLTHVRNKGAYASYIEELQKGLDEADGKAAFAVGVFDCDNLKLINDRYGHDKGDTYLMTACRLICHVFEHSPVFRIGGDEFCVILQNDDLQNMYALAAQFSDSMEEINAAAESEWEQAHVAMGIAVYDSETDRSVSDVVRRADELMYENKRIRKAGR